MDKWCKRAAFALMISCGGVSEAEFINYAAREVNIKIVYYGPATAALLENLRFIYEGTAPEDKGKMISLSTETETTVFFDFLPRSLGDVRGFTTRLHLFAIRENYFNNEFLRLVLKGADAVVFVADCDPRQTAATIQSWTSLKENLAEHGYDWRGLPIVVQLNHSNHPKAVRANRMKRLLHAKSQPMLMASPITGEGMVDALLAAAKLVLVELRQASEK